MDTGRTLISLGHPGHPSGRTARVYGLRPSLRRGSDEGEGPAPREQGRRDRPGPVERPGPDHERMGPRVAREPPGECGPVREARGSKVGSLRGARLLRPTETPQART